MRGRKPTPTAQKRLAGNPGKRPLNTDEPEYPMPTDSFETPAPELMGDTVASEEWARLVPMLRQAKTIREADRGSLVALCQQWSLYLKANTLVASSGLVVKAPSGYPMVNPYLPIASKALAHCTKLWAELGLTPTSRSRVTTAEDPREPNPFAQFLQSRHAPPQ